MNTLGQDLGLEKLRKLFGLFTKCFEGQRLTSHFIHVPLSYKLITCEFVVKLGTDKVCHQKIAIMLKFYSRWSICFH